MDLDFIKLLLNLDKSPATPGTVLFEPYSKASRRIGRAMTAPRVHRNVAAERPFLIPRDMIEERTVLADPQRTGT